jgi:alkanesulfonate monooxygenase SsuD/methylene tetrahydromethanopterin reductase-like flavin-dependent oxidoreductase (luciferase family)
VVEVAERADVVVQPDGLSPFAAGSISLGLSAVGGDARAIAGRLRDDAVTAVSAGFDGVTLSEHHGGFPHYVPSPLTLAAGILGQLPRGWAVAAPAILPLRPPMTVAEDLAWLAALYPGRVGAGFVPGYQRRDFELLGAEFDGRHTAFWRGLATLVGTLGAGSPLHADPAIASADLPVLVGVSGPVAARRAAAAGVGMLVTSLRRPAEVQLLVDAYTTAGGTKPAILIRRVHVGNLAAGGFGRSMADWRSRAEASASWLAADDDSLVSGSPEAVADQLARSLTDSGCRALNIRVDAYTAQPELIADQMAALGELVLPALRSRMLMSAR